MHKHKQIVNKIISLISLSLFMSASIYSVQEYSSIIGLFNDFNIQISGNDYIDALLIESEIYPQISSSLLTVNLTDIQNKLESMEYIEAVQVSRLVPHILSIHIIERVPILLINKDDEIIFMDKNGIFLPADEKSIGTFPVPVLSILDVNGSMDRYMGDIAQFVQFILSEYPVFYNNLSEVKIEEDFWEFYSDYNTKIYAHASYLINQLNILKDFEKTVYPVRNLQDYLYIDLRVKDQVIVKEKYPRS